jgi:hypothetical protein
MFSKVLKMLVKKDFKNDCKLVYESGFQNMSDVDIISAAIEEGDDEGENWRVRVKKIEIVSLVIIA